MMWETLSGTEFDVMCGVPYTALPIATCMSLSSKVPMLMSRKEEKDNDTKKAIEGAFKPGQKCLIVEDLVTSGMSVMETVDPLKHVGLEVSDVVVLIDREQGGEANVNKNGLNLHSVLKITQVLQVLFKNGKVSQEIVDNVKKFIAENQTSSAPKKPEQKKRKRYSERAASAKNAVAKELFDLMETKETNLSVAADVYTTPELLKIADVRLASL